MPRNIATEAPILFSAPMIRALLAGTKTVTRRLVNMNTLKLQPRRRIAADLPELTGDRAAISPSYRYPAGMNDHGAVFAKIADFDDPKSSFKSFGLKPGEFDFDDPFTDGSTHLGDYGDGRRFWTLTPTKTLWVRETWRAPARADHITPSELGAMVGGLPVWYEADSRWRRWSSRWGKAGKTRTSIHMPRWASRITLVVERIRYEKLHAITEDEAKAEGVVPFDMKHLGADQQLTCGARIADAPYRASFAVLWDELNAERATWKSNPWVRAITFAVRVAS